MFGRKKREDESTEAGPYLVESLDLRPKQLQAALNKRHAEGYDVVHMHNVNVLGPSGMLRVVFKKRDAD